MDGHSNVLGFNKEQQAAPGTPSVRRSLAISARHTSSSRFQTSATPLLLDIIFAANMSRTTLERNFVVPMVSSDRRQSTRCSKLVINSSACSALA